MLVVGNLSQCTPQTRGVTNSVSYQSVIWIVNISGGEILNPLKPFGPLGNIWTYVLGPNNGIVEFFVHQGLKLYHLTSSNNTLFTKRKLHLIPQFALVPLGHLP